MGKAFSVFSGLPVAFGTKARYMPIIMARPYRRGAAGTFTTRKVVPEELRGIVGQRELKASLRVSDEAAARVAGSAKMAEFEAIIAFARAQLKGEAVQLPPREIDAVVGRWYRSESAKIEEAPGKPHDRDIAQDIAIDERRMGDSAPIGRLSELWSRRLCGSSI